jgi:hypothetical protein
MIHKSARAMVLEQFGPTAWDQILHSAKLDDGDFVSAQPYPDETTFRLIGAAASTAGLTVDQTLLAFGHHWVKTADQGLYSNVMASNQPGSVVFSGMDGEARLFTVTFDPPAAE